MELSARKKQILKAIIGDYIRTAEPVGSKALTEGHELPFSSATIRNEMSELEEMGYLEKPHTSAGRIPSPQGYRLYVDELMEKPGETADDDGAALQQTVLAKVRELDHLVQEAGRLLTSLTNYASVAITPALAQISIRQFEIIAVDKMNFVIVVVTDSGTVKNKMVRTVSEVTKDEAELLTYVLNQTLTGLPLSSITAERFDIVRRAAGLTALLAPVAEYIAELIAEPHALKHRFGSAAAFGTVDARYRERKLNVCKHRLMRDEIVTLKNKADRMIAVCVPVAVAEGVCRLAVYFKLAGCISVKSADDIEKCGLAAARWTQHRHELAVTEGQGNALQRFDRRVARNIAFSDLLKCEHQCLRSSGVPYR